MVDPDCSPATTECRVRRFDPARGACVEVPAADGTPCGSGDRDPLTICGGPSVCLDGTCAPDARGSQWNAPGRALAHSRTRPDRIHYYDYEMYEYAAYYTADARGAISVALDGEDPGWGHVTDFRQPFVGFGDTVSTVFGGSWQAWDAVTGAKAWSNRPLAERLAAEGLADARVNHRTVSIDDHRYIFLITHWQKGTSIWTVDTRNGAVTPSPWIEGLWLTDPIADEQGILYAAIDQTVSSAKDYDFVVLEADGTVRWALATGARSPPVAVFNGRVFLKDGTVVSSRAGTILYRLEVPPTFVTPSRIFSFEDCRASKSAPSCARIIAFDPATGARVWERTVERLLSNFVLAGDSELWFTVSEGSVGCEDAQPFDGCSPSVVTTSYTVDRDGNEVARCEGITAGGESYFIGGDVLSTHFTDGYRNHRWNWDRSVRVHGLRQPRGWLGYAGGPHQDWRPR